MTRKKSTINIRLALWIILAASVAIASGMCNGCAYQGTGKGCLVIGYQHSTYEIGLPVSSGSPIDKDGRGYGNGNAAVLIDCQAIVSRGSGNSNNVAPVLSIPAVGGL